MTSYDMYVCITCVCMCVCVYVWSDQVRLSGPLRVDGALSSIIE